MTLNDLKNRNCTERAAALSSVQAAERLSLLPGWSLQGACIQKEFKFEGFERTMAFVNAVAWISHRQNHHPDMHVGYNQCRVVYTTHSVSGLSENDFICAARVEGLMA